MSRSYRKTNIIGHGNGSEKKDKRFANRKLRRAVKNDIIKGEEDFPMMKELSDVWNFRKDGKQYFGTYDAFMSTVAKFHNDEYWKKVWRDMKGK